MSLGDDENSDSLKPTIAAYGDKTPTFGVDDISAQIASPISPEDKNSVHDEDYPSLPEVPQGHTSGSDRIINDLPKSEEAEIGRETQSQAPENIASSSYQKPYVESLTSEKSGDEWDAGQDARLYVCEPSMSEPSCSEEDGNKEYTDSLSIEELSNKRSDEQSDVWSEYDDWYESEDWSESDDWSEPSISPPRSLSTQHDGPSIPQHDGNPSANPPPPICRPLPDGTFRNPFTSSKQDVMAMFDATRAAKNANQRTPWIRWLQEDKNAMRQSQIDSSEYRRRLKNPGQATSSTQVPSAPTIEIQAPPIGQYENKKDPNRDGYNGQWRQEGNYFQHGLQVDPLRGTTRPPDPLVDHSSPPKNIVTVNLPPSPSTSPSKPINSSDPLYLSWAKSEFQIDNGVHTQLLTISSIEHYYDVFGKSMATITKLDQSKVNDPVSRTYWL
ncbi:hypothetical protein F4821DRAFT_140126 [Hypoxylon rubiginosum]|uniref:Uncharacterized protein n=1 Tax=Hypoxylon rubiginosum TaxID=110542 RepID=A0ACC0D077_9PEZI|nr:hypothetical protein F4821DRAFT_140126 [Hypoxylon rubiginosum]